MTQTKMNEIWIHPTENGYSFSMQDTRLKSELLKLLTQEDFCTTGNPTLLPFFKYHLIGRFIKTHIVYMVGFSSHNFTSSIHRGSYSIWCLAKVHSIRTTPTKIQIKTELRDLLKIFEDNKTSPENFKESISNHILNQTKIDKIKETNMLTLKKISM